jgi:N6-adenosine-specific RNA methylase IME4/ParB-like chromosome segregation protein Spo0J
MLEVKLVALSAICVERRTRKDYGDITALAQSIQQVGLLHPIVLDSQYRLIAGERRLRAVQQLGRSDIPATIAETLDDIEQALLAERDENTERKNWTPSEAVAMAERLAPYEKQAAEARQKSGKNIDGTAGARGHKSVETQNLRKTFPKVSSPEQHRSQARTATAVGLSRPTLTKAQAVVKAAQQNPDLSHLVTKMDETGKVDGVYRQLQKILRAEEIRHELSPLPTGPFRVIVVDPPWHYEKRADDVTQRAACPYPTLPTEAIEALPVAALAHEDAILWLWSTNAHLPEAFRVVEAWGFTYKTLLTWVKDRMGVGDWLRGQTEQCVLAIRGKPTVVLTNQTTLLEASVREHSRKPQAFYALVEALCPGSKVELFAREVREGWVAHGTPGDQFAPEPAAPAGGEPAAQISREAIRAVLPALPPRFTSDDVVRQIGGPYTVVGRILYDMVKEQELRFMEDGRYERAG